MRNICYMNTDLPTFEFIFLTERASSKSFASLGSIVNVAISLTSILFFISEEEIFKERPFKKRKLCLEKDVEKP